MAQGVGGLPTYCWN